MQVTLLGLLLVPLSLLWAFRPERLLQLALISAVFEAAAALVLGGSFGLQPAMVPGLLFIVYVSIQYAIGMRYPGEGTVLLTVMPLFALLLYAVLSAWLLPDAFAGQILVEPQKRDMMSLDPLVPLQFTFGNVTQTLYLALNVAFTTAVAVFLTRSSIRYESIIAAYLLGGYIVAGLTFWQFASRIGGVPFPDDLLHSNPGWVTVEQALGSVPRVQGPFTEPSALAGYMCGVVICCLWLSAKGYRTMRPNVLLAIGIFSVFLSTSATGIVTLALGLPLTLGIASIGGDPAALARIGKTSLGVLLAGVIAATPVLVLKPSLVTSVSTIIDSTLNKGDSQSFEERSSWDAGALATIVPTYGLGVGWGSFRSSSLIPGLLANGGIFAIVMIVWLVLRVVRLGLRARASARGHPGQILVDGFTASLCVQFGTALISAPMISSMSFFLQLGCVIGVLTRMSLNVGRSARVGLMPGHAHRF